MLKYEPSFASWKPVIQARCLLYSAFTNKVERVCHFQASCWNYMTRRQALRDFPYTSQVSLHKKLTYLF
jgi:hypothetical protein